MLLYSDSLKLLNWFPSLEAFCKLQFSSSPLPELPSPAKVNDAQKESSSKDLQPD